MQLYKPNSKSSGHAMSLQLTTEESGKGIYLEMIKQTGWNDQTKKGSFKDGQKVKIKFNETEVAGMIFGIRNVCDAKFFHSTEAAKTSIGVNPWIDKSSGNHIGTSLSVSRDGSSFLMGLTLGESEQVAQWLEFALREIFTAEHFARVAKYSQN